VCFYSFTLKVSTFAVCFPIGTILYMSKEEEVCNNKEGESVAAVASPRKNEVDMLHGPLLGKILMFAMPFALSGVLEQLFNSVDVMVVGRFASSEAMAAVGANTFLINLCINLFVGMSVGANVILSNHIGQCDNRAIRHAVSTTMVLSVISGFLLLLIGLLIAPMVLRAMDTPANVINDAITYLRIWFLGAPFFMVYNFGASVLRSKGDTRRPLYILIIAGIINTVVALVTVIVFKMSVVGVGMANDVAYVFSAIAVVYLLRKEQGPFRLDYRHLHIYGVELKRILQIGIPAGIQGMVFSFSNIFVQSAINSYGSAAMAGASASQIFDAYCYFLLNAFSGACVTFMGQNYGAGEIERCKRIFRICLVCGALFTLAGNMILFFGEDYVLKFFTTDPEVAHYAKLRIAVTMTTQWIASFYEIPASAMRGLGHSIEPALMTVFGTCVFRLIWIFTIHPIWSGFTQLMVIYPASWLLTDFIVFPAFLIISRRAFKFVKS